METLSREPDRVVFGVGAESATAELLIELGAQRVLLIAQDRHAEGAARIAHALGSRATFVFTTDRPQVPAEVAAAAVARARTDGVDWVLAHGGGTPIGIAKAIALELPVKIAAVPTTYAGSERTNIWGITRDERKLTGRDDRVRPRLVVYDPSLTLALDRALSLDSLWNALAHSVEALYANDATPEARRAAEDSLSLLIAGITTIAKDPQDLAGRTLALRGASLASLSLGAASMGLHHKLAHVLGGTLGTPHARTHATLLPYTLGFNAPAVPETVQLLARAWNTDDPPAFIYDLQRSLGLATSLRALGVTAAQALRVVDEVLLARYPNPRAIDRNALVTLLDDALHDRRPSLHTLRSVVPSGAQGPHAAMTVTWRGAPIEDARVVVLALHGRGASADRFAADLQRRLETRNDVAFVAPQARDNTWYPKGFLAPLAENQPWLDSALSVVDALWQKLASTLDARRIIVVGFSQGACLALTWLSRTAARPQHVLAFTGAATPLPDADYAAASGVTLYIGSAEKDPWVTRDVVESSAARFAAAHAQLTLSVVPGDLHELHAPDTEALLRAVEAAASGDS